MAEFTPIATMVKPPSADFGQINSLVQMGRNSKWKKKMDGTVVLRDPVDH